jgi:hypothetical protein
VAGVALLALGVGNGCGYTLRPPYDGTIKTVYVPVFRSYSFRKDANLQLTETVIKEIERRTPYRVVESPEDADTILSGTVIFTNKNVIVQNPNNLPRQLTADLSVDVTWEDVRPGADRNVPPPKVRCIESVTFVPELGETASLGYQKAYQQIAQQIVGMMEQSW